MPCDVCRINKASTEWLEGVRKPAAETDGSGAFQDPDRAEAVDSGEAPSEEQEKTTAVTSV